MYCVKITHRPQLPFVVLIDLFYAIIFRMRSRRLEHQPVATPIGTGKFGLAIAEIVARENTPNHLITRSETRIKQSIESFYTVPPSLSTLKKVMAQMCHHFHHSPIELRAVGSELAHSDSRHRERSDCHDETTDTSVCERLWLHDNEQRATGDRGG